MSEAASSMRRSGALYRAGEVVATLLVASSIAVALWVIIDNVRLVQWSAAHGAEVGWLDSISGALLVCAPGLVALWFSLRRRPIGAAILALLGLLLAGASWIGMRS